jgi:hypothetical protein
MLGKKVVVSSLFVALMVTLAIIFRPIPEASSSNTQRTYGTIEEVFESGSLGIVFKLKGDNRLFYLDIDHGGGPVLQLHKSDLQGQNAEIHFVRHSTPIYPLNRRRQIARMEVNKMTLYSAFK